MKLGSLFDGSGGFPLAGAIHGITPVWASEIEPYPIRVTKARFPQMKHLGSVLDVNGAEIEPVDIITFGSPCQDLSVAGKQAGLHKGERSNLFFEAIRIIKEMRDATDNLYPRIAIWENVPGAYSSNKGEDFRAVLEAFAQINDEAADVPRPAAGKWNPAGAILGNGWSVAWRTFDAQYWGVPQRRKRIYLIADFGSERAGKILFEQDRVPRDSAACGEAGQGAAGDAEGSVGGSGVNGLAPQDVQSFGHDKRSAKFTDDGKTDPLTAIDYKDPMIVTYPAPTICFKERAGCPGGGKGILCGDKPFTLSAMTDQAVCYAVRTAQTNANGIGVAQDAHTLDGANAQAVCYPINTMVATRHKADDGRTTFGVGENGDPQFTLGAAHEHAVCYPIDSHQQDSRFKVCADGISPTLPGQMGTGGNNGPMVLFDKKSISEYECSGVSSTQQARQYKSPDDLVVVESTPPRKYIVRRLTPLECSRLQGFPDDWCGDLETENPTEEDVRFWSEVWETHRRVMGKSKTPRSRAQIVKWLQDPYSDAAEYKMWGNGVALPNAEYVIRQSKKLLTSK